MPDSSGPAACEVCGAAWAGGDVCGRCGWMRAPAADGPGLEVAGEAPPGAEGWGRPARARSAAPGRAARPGPQGAPPAPARRGLFRRRSDGERALARVRRAAWIGLLLLLVAGGAAVRLLYPRLDVMSRLADLRSDAMKVVDVATQPSVSYGVVRTRVDAWARSRGLDVVPGTTRVRVMRVPPPTTAGEAAAAMGADQRMDSDRWYRVAFKVTVRLSKWGYAREYGVRAARIVALSGGQVAEEYGADGQIVDDDPEAATADPEAQAQVREESLIGRAKPGVGRDMTTEGSVTGLGLSVAAFVGEVRRLDADVAALAGVPGLNMPLDDGAWAAARKRVADVPLLLERADRLRERASGLQEAVEVRYGLRLGKPWAGLGRALALLRQTLGHLQEGSRASFSDGLDRYDQWHHAALLSIEGQLTDKGVFLGESGDAKDAPGGSKQPVDVPGQDR